MRVKIFVLMILLVAGLGLACERNGTDHRTAMSDSDLENAIKAKLNTDAQLKAANLDVDADASKNTATISGTVATEAMRTRAVEMAKSAHANIVVTDKIDVKPREVSRAEYTEEMARTQREKAKASGDTLGSTLDDAWIHTKIVAQLIGDSRTPERKINVDVNNNIVTLRGTVDDNNAKAAAERIARATDGVKGVKNQLKVGAADAAKPKK